MKNNGTTAVAALIVSLLFIAACSSVSEPEPPPPPPVLTSIEVSPPVPSIAPGTTLQFRADGRYSNNAKNNVTSLATWTSSNTAIATVDTHGLVSAVSSTSGTATIIASYGGLSGSTVLTSSDLASIAVAPANQVIAKGTTVQFSATGTLDNAVTQNISAYVTWGSSNTGIADISNSGLATAGTTTGTATIFATFSSITGSTQLTSADVASIAVTPPDTSIALGTTQQYTATGTLTAVGSPTQDLTTHATWTSSLPSVAMISNTGLATSQGTGTTFITATYLVTSNTATLTVTPASLLSITLTPVNPSIVNGKTQQFTATGAFSDGSHQDITSSSVWISSKTEVATISNATGSIGLAASVGVGTTTITATSGSKSGSTTLTVTPAMLESILVTPISATVSLNNQGNTQQFTATGILTDGSLQDLTKSVTWASSNPDIPISNATGFQGLATNTFFTPGSTNITATFSGITSNTATLTFNF